MRFRVFSIFAALFALTIWVSGCSWLPTYMKAKAAINERYEKKEAQIEARYAKGQISDETYDRLYEELYAQWDNELTVAKARAQGYEVASSQRSSRKRRTSGPSPNSNVDRFETYTTEYVGSTSREGGSASSRTNSSASQPAQ